MIHHLVSSVGISIKNYSGIDWGSASLFQANGEVPLRHSSSCASRDQSRHAVNHVTAGTNVFDACV